MFRSIAAGGTVPPAAVAPAGRARMGYGASLMISGCLPRVGEDLARRLGPLLFGAVLLALAGCESESPLQKLCRNVRCEAGLVCAAVEGEARCLPPSDPCGANNPCDDDELCTIRANGGPLCLPRSKCQNVQCQSGERCDLTTGQCVAQTPDCRTHGCNQGYRCEVASGRCLADPAACQVCCGSDEVCDPAQNLCVPNKCLTERSLTNGRFRRDCDCGPTQACQPLSGTCVDIPGRCGICAANQYCDEHSGLCTTIPATQVGAGEIGAACGSAGDCGRAGANGFCITDGGLFGAMPGGMCSASCDQTGCPGGAACVDFGIALCLDVCLSDKECRDGYGCQGVFSGDPRRFCFPRGTGGSACTGGDCRPIGSSCSEDDDCEVGARCRRDFPGGYCMKTNCNPRTECLDGSCLCLNADPCSDTTLALAACNIFDQDCRPGYACYQVRASGEGYCYLRSCEDDLDCRVAGDSCSVAKCDPARGVCDLPCADNAECAGGRVCGTAVAASEVLVVNAAGGEKKARLQNAPLVQGTLQLFRPVQRGGDGVGEDGALVSASASWVANAYQGKVLVDARGGFFPITASTATKLTVSGRPADGSFAIFDPEARLKEGLNYVLDRRSGELELVQALVAGDKLVAYAAAPSGEAYQYFTGQCQQPCSSDLDYCGPDARCDVSKQRCVRKCRTDATCPAEHWCHPGGSSPQEQRLAGSCIPKCPNGLQCRAEEFCDRLGRCRPRCESDAACSSLEYCDGGECRLKCTATSGCTFGQFCDTQGAYGPAGRCRPDLRHTLVGAACEQDGQCGAFNATCLRAGWPGGYCASTGCSSSVPCGSDAACAAVGESTACLKKCTVGVSGTCRSGYACTERDGATVCVPQ